MMEINKIHQGDCLELMKQIDDKSINMILCDLPYGVTARNKWDVIIPFDKLWQQYERIISDKGAIVLTATQPFTSQVVVSNINLFKYEWIWEKTKTLGFLNAKKQPLRNHEQILIFYKQQPIYNPQGIQLINKKCDRGSKDGVGTNYNQANPVYTQTQTNYPKSVLKISSEGKTMHPTQKPLALFEYLIKTYSNERDLILDNCIGSGTTAVACKQTNRNFIGIEKEQKYVDIANKRLQQHTL